MPDGTCNSPEVSTSSPCRADLWTVDPRTITPEESVQILNVLSPTERQRLRCFHFEDDRAAHLAAHALKRFGLSALDPEIPPEVWRFINPPNGRPEISFAPGPSRWRFNLSHTRTLVACIITQYVDCGVDVEALSLPFETLDLVSRVLAPSERAILNATSEGRRHELFMRYWTLKEAYSKALGLGMQLDFCQIAFELRDGSARLQPDSSEWHFHQWKPDDTHVLATAIRTSAPVRLFRHIGIPGMSERIRTDRVDPPVPVTWNERLG